MYWYFSPKANRTSSQPIHLLIMGLIQLPDKVKQLGSNQNKAAQTPVLLGTSQSSPPLVQTSSCRLMLDLSTRECSTLRTLWTFQILGLERRKSISSSDFLAVLQRYWLKDWNYRKKQRFSDEQLVSRCSGKCTKLTICSHKCITRKYKLHGKKKFHVRSHGN